MIAAEAPSRAAKLVYRSVEREELLQLVVSHKLHRGIAEARVVMNNTVDITNREGKEREGVN
jgi:hypothetical protein